MTAWLCHEGSFDDVSMVQQRCDHFPLLLRRQLFTEAIDLDASCQELFHGVASEEVVLQAMPVLECAWRTASTACLAPLHWTCPELRLFVPLLLVPVAALPPVGHAPVLHQLADACLLHLLLAESALPVG